MSIPSAPWTKAQLGKMVNQLSMTSANVALTDHFMDRLLQRGITLDEAFRCMQRGVIVRGPTFNPTYGTFEFRMEEKKPNDIVCVALAIAPLANPSGTIALTAWEI
ncbi:hypothetical protein TU80_29310 [Pseudomonas veronii]|jgi:hypothetical protein|nr:hypothetical protein TU80_29310 [Pseudomonas veronii]OPK01860.1 hypothetical protein BZ164_25450 [Pseudomonas veronii]SEC70258.1 hypothetical protein SAMN04490199_5419 [Pseudomonas marginalis]